MNLKFNKCIIRDGITLNTIKTNKFKTCVLKLAIALPSSNNEKEMALFGLMINVLRCGTEKYPEKADIIKRLGDLYDASCLLGGYASGDNKIVEISSEMLSDKFSETGEIMDGVVELMYQLLYCPVTDGNGLFKKETVEREKKAIIDKLKSEKNNSREYAFKRCREIMCCGEPYGASIKISQVESITTEELSSFYNDFLAKINFTFYYVGDKSADNVINVINKYFAQAFIGTAKPLISLRSKEANETKEKSEELDIKQGILVMGFRTGILLGTPFSIAMRVFNNIYGGTCNSRLFTTVREKMGLCYYCDSDYVSTKGLMFVSCGFDVSDREKAQAEILNQLNILKKEYIDHNELQVAKDLAIKEIQEMMDYPSAIAAFTYAHEIYGYSADVTEIIRQISEVTAEDIINIANKIKLDTVFFLKGTAEENDDVI